MKSAIQKVLAQYSGKETREAEAPSRDMTNAWMDTVRDMGVKELMYHGGYSMDDLDLTGSRIKSLVYADVTDLEDGTYEVMFNARISFRELSVDVNGSMSNEPVPMGIVKGEILLDIAIVMYEDGEIE